MDKFDLKKFIAEGKLIKEEKYTKIKDFDDYISGMYDASVDQEAEDGMQSGIWLKKEEGNPDEYYNTDVFDDLVDFLKENGKQTLEGNPDIVVNKDGEDIRWSAMVVGDESKYL